MFKKKGQITVEFIIVLVILFIIFGFALFTYSERNSGFIYSREFFEARNFANKIALTINKIYLAGNGAETIFLLDDKGYGFDVNFVGRAVEISWRDNFVDAPLLTDQIIVGDFNVGKFVLVKRDGSKIIFGKVIYVE